MLEFDSRSWRGVLYTEHGEVYSIEHGEVYSIQNMERCTLYRTGEVYSIQSMERCTLYRAWRGVLYTEHGEVYSIQSMERCTLYKTWRGVLSTTLSDIVCQLKQVRPITRTWSDTMFDIIYINKPKCKKIYIQCLSNMYLCKDQGENRFHLEFHKNWHVKTEFS